MRLCVIESHCAHRDPLVLTHSSQHYSLRIDLRRRGYDAAIDLGSVAASAEKLAYIAEREGKPTGAPVEYEEFHFHPQVPGGMLRSEEPTSELQSLMRSSYAVFCLTYKRQHTHYIDTSSYTDPQSHNTK